jgi:hypothetical protein
MVGDIEELLTHLSASGVRYLVVGGVAVVLHGFLRATADLDLVIDLERGNAEVAIDAFERLGFRPRPPVPMRAFADENERQRWIEEKHLEVFSLWHSAKPGFEVDLFVRLPFDFDDALARASTARVGDCDVYVASIDDLVAMKRRAGRPRDQEDIDALLALKSNHERREK